MTTVTGTLCSIDGPPPASHARCQRPKAAATCDDTLAGALEQLGYLNAAAGGASPARVGPRQRLRRLTTTFYDRGLSMGGLSGTVLTAQTVGG